MLDNIDHCNIDGGAAGCTHGAGAGAGAGCTHGAGAGGDDVDGDDVDDGIVECVPKVSFAALLWVGSW